MPKPVNERLSLLADQLQAMIEELRRGNRAAPAHPPELDTLQQALVVLDRLAKRSKAKAKKP